jgi:hypothetical protein
LEKIKVYQVNVNIIDQEIYLILADYLRKNSNITKINISLKSIEDLKEKYDTDISYFTSKNNASSINNSMIYSNLNQNKSSYIKASNIQGLNRKKTLKSQIQNPNEPISTNRKKSIKRIPGNSDINNFGLNGNFNSEIEEGKLNGKKNDKENQNQNINNKEGSLSQQDSLDDEEDDQYYEDSDFDNYNGFNVEDYSELNQMKESICQTKNPIKGNFILFYEILSTKINLLELSVFIFIKDNHLVLLSKVLENCKNLRKLGIRNFKNFSGNSTQNQELDIAYDIYNSLSFNTKDEIYILFNQINQLKDLEILKITHFNFNSDINYLACQSALSLKKLHFLDLTGNQGIINNYLNVEENYSLVNSNLTKINFGNIYFHLIRNFEIIIHPEKIKICEMGIFDSVSLSSFLHYLSKTKIEKIKITLNKPCTIDSFELLLKILANHIFIVKNLKYFYLINTYTEETYEKNKVTIENWIKKLFIENMSKSKTFRKLSFNHKKTFSCEIPNFYYIKEKNLIVTMIILFVLNNKFKNSFKKIDRMYKAFNVNNNSNNSSNKNINNSNTNSKLSYLRSYIWKKKDRFKENILKRIVLFVSGKPRQIIL